MATTSTSMTHADIPMDVEQVDKLKERNKEIEKLLKIVDIIIRLTEVSNSASVGKI